MLYDVHVHTAASTVIRSTTVTTVLELLCVMIVSYSLSHGGGSNFQFCIGLSLVRRLSIRRLSIRRLAIRQLFLCFNYL